MPREGTALGLLAATTTENALWDACLKVRLEKMRLGQFSTKNAPRTQEQGHETEDIDPSQSPENLLIFRSSTYKRPVHLLKGILESKLGVVDEPRVSCESCWYLIHDKVAGVSGSGIGQGGRKSYMAR